MINPNLESQPNLELIRQRLETKQGKEYWRSLKELSNDPEFEALVRQEFPRQAAQLDFLNRRDFLKVLGAALALGGLAACTPQAPDKILPYTNPPQEIIPGQSLYFASSQIMDGYAKGVLVETTMGRPIKIEGNPQHPESQGATDIFMQASILELYNPFRTQKITYHGQEKTWQEFASTMNASLANIGTGSGLRLVSGPVSSPSLAAQIKAWLGKFPEARWVQFSPTRRENALAGAKAAFGQPYEMISDFSKADVILSLDCDFLFSEPGNVRYARDFAQRHQPISTNGTMNRLYVVESSATLTGSNADHRLALKPSQVEAFTQAIANRLGVQVQAPSENLPGQAWLDPLAADLKKAGSSALIVAGERQPPSVHALALAMNQALGSLGNTIIPIEPIIVDPGDHGSSLADLVQELNNGQVDTLVILEGNPAYSAPVDLQFAEAMPKARQSIYLAYYPDETAHLANWIIPAANSMEVWGDARSYEGTVSLIQPVIQPLFGGKAASELIATLDGQPEANSHDLVRLYWQDHLPGENFARDWDYALSKGLIPNSASKPATDLSSIQPTAFSSTSQPPSQGLELVFEPDYTVWDGSFGYNAWLQELPKPLTKLTWDNAAFISPSTADRLGLKTGDVVDLKLPGRSVTAPVALQPGQPEDVVVVSLGYGHGEGSNLAQGLGFDAYQLRTSQALWFEPGLQITKTGQNHTLAFTYDHWTMENRDLVRAATLDEYQANPSFAQDVEGTPPTLYGEYVYDGYAWGMAINLSACIGCNACVVACQAENNIPTVGKEGVLNSREMHWLRIDRYYKGTPEQPDATFFEPVPCMQCEKAPCEAVCPVEATSHSAEGLNEMTYNRCVGTRYCSNNCPYKVRRFNFYNYVAEDVIPLKAMRNPDVTVRMRGVMEKCTYCVQRISHARVRAELENRTVEDGEIQTACMQACPTRAITFGNINDLNSNVRKLKEQPLNYSLLADLGTQPRTTFLAKVTNPNPVISSGYPG